MGEGRGSGRWRSIFRRDARSEIDEELAFHLEQRVRDHVARGLDEESARAAARERLGDLGRVRAECAGMLASEQRAAARRDWLRVSSLDFRLGLRMLVRYPGLTLLGGLAMAFAILVGAGAFEFITQLTHPRLPLPDGDRIVGVQLWDAAASRVERRAVHDFLRWRSELRTIQDLGAFRVRQRNLVTGPGDAAPAEAAEISAAAFRVARVQPLLGRSLQEADEAADAAPVVVLGHSVWQHRFDGDPAVVGRVVRLSGMATTVVGVMPEDFAFPITQNLWVPLRLDAATAAPVEGPAIRMFGRLAPGATLAEAQAELALAGRRAAADYPATHAQLRPEVLPYARSILNISVNESRLLLSSNIFLIMLLVLVCSNVALLMFARAASRENEIVVRSALGASRGRIIAQLFAEALVLGGLALGLGLAVAGVGLRWGFGVAEANYGRLAFWVHPSLSPATVLYACLLTVLGAGIAGVLPGRRVTCGLQTGLRAAGLGGVSFGGVWTAVIVAQVAITVAFPVTTFFLRRDAEEIRALDARFPYEQYLAAGVELDRAGDPAATAAEHGARVRSTVAELRRRLEAEPGVTAVTYADLLPRMYHPHRLIELDGGDALPIDPRWAGYRVSAAAVAPDFFAAFAIPIMAGRGFHSGDLGSDHRIAIVNQAFVQRVLGGRSPVGRQFRFTHFEEWPDDRMSTTEPWIEIVGLVPDLDVNAGDYDPKAARIYLPTSPEAAYPLHIAVRARSAPESLAPRLRVLAASIDPALTIRDPVRMDRLSVPQLKFLDFWFRLTLFVSGIALLLSLAAIYAVMSFAVSRRTREIGIRVALGARPRSLLGAVFRRPLRQIGLGIVAGGVLVVVFMLALTGGELTLRHAALIAGYAVLMLCVCMTACVVPTRRALRIAPADAMRTD